MKILECFKTPVWIEEKPEFINALNKASDPYIKEARERNKEYIKKNGDFGTAYHSTILTENSKFKDFHNYVGQKCFDFLDWQGFDMSQYTTFFEQSWVQEFSKKGGGHHAAHIHANTHVNAFYFLKCSPETSYPIFYEPRTGARSTKLRLKPTNDILYGTEFVYVKPVPGTLVIFPGYLEHEYTVDHGKKPFRFIHICISAILKDMSKKI